VTRYLSDDWFDAAGAAITASESLAAATAGVTLGIDYEVTGTPFGKRRYGVRLNEGSVRFEVPPEGEAEVSFTVDYDTACEIARGVLPVQVAFMQGRLKLDGDVAVLVRSGPALDEVTDVFAALRDSTEFS
jgi:hypothetical protein